MPISVEKFERTLEHLKPTDWEFFEKLASVFLAQEWPKLRTMASASGDGGRDAQLFSPEEEPNVLIQFSVQEHWDPKIKGTIKKMKSEFPNSNILIYCTNQKIGARADKIVSDARKDSIFVDVRDISWFTERLYDGSNAAKLEIASRLSERIIDPLLKDLTSRANAGLALTNNESKTALLFLEMQWKNESSEKGLTKSAFEALVRAALLGTDAHSTVSRDIVHERVAKFLPNHQIDALKIYIDGALNRLKKNAVTHRRANEFHLRFDEAERIKQSTSDIALLKLSLDKEIDEILGNIQNLKADHFDKIKIIIKKAIETYFLKKGEEFVAFVNGSSVDKIDSNELKSIIIPLCPVGKFVKGKTNLEIIIFTITSLLTIPSDNTKKYLDILRNAYTMFAFLEVTPDVQGVTSKLFSKAILWLDTTVLLPVIAEQAFPEDFRPFTSMFKQARAVGMTLCITPGIAEEVERHLNLCLICARSPTWSGDVPYVFAQYLLAGRSKSTFASWVENFQGSLDPVDDIMDYFIDAIGADIEDPEYTDLDDDLVKGVQSYWDDVQSKRRGTANLNSYALAQHDADNCLTVVQQRKKTSNTNRAGSTSWWFTLDRAAREMPSKLDHQIWEKIGKNPVISVDNLIKYFFFGPRRDKINRIDNNLNILFDDSVIINVPLALLDLAQDVRASMDGMPERIIQRKIKEAMFRESTSYGDIQDAAIEDLTTVIKNFSA